MPYTAQCDRKDCKKPITDTDVIYELCAVGSPSQPPMWTMTFHWQCLGKFVEEEISKDETED